MDPGIPEGCGCPTAILAAAETLCWWGKEAPARAKMQQRDPQHLLNPLATGKTPSSILTLSIMAKIRSTLFSGVFSSSGSSTVFPCSSRTGPGHAPCLEGVPRRGLSPHTPHQDRVQGDGVGTRITLSNQIQTLPWP